MSCNSLAKVVQAWNDRLAVLWRFKGGQLLRMPKYEQYMRDLGRAVKMASSVSSVAVLNVGWLAADMALALVGNSGQVLGAAMYGHGANVSQPVFVSIGDSRSRQNPGIYAEPCYRLWEVLVISLCISRSALPTSLTTSGRVARIAFGDLDTGSSALGCSSLRWKLTNVTKDGCLKWHHVKRISMHSTVFNLSRWLLVSGNYRAQSLLGHGRSCGSGVQQTQNSGAHSSSWPEVTPVHTHACRSRLMLECVSTVGTSNSTLLHSGIGTEGRRIIVTSFDDEALLASSVLF